MSHRSFNFKLLFEELDPTKLQRKFLQSLLEIQHVERGSIWVKKDESYQCVEALGSHSEKIHGVSIDAQHPSIVGWVIENGKMTIAEPGRDERHYKEIEDSFDIKSKLILCFPLFRKNGEVYGAIQIIDTSAGGNQLKLDKDYLDLLHELVDIGSIALCNSLVFTDQVAENIRLKRTIDAIRCEHPIIGRSSLFLNVLKVTKEYARTDFPVLITGESGTGKELIAKGIHAMSNRRDKGFLVQNCSAIPDALLESELFGYTKGAFTGALKDKVGLFEAADGGTVFLDEIGDMPLNLQARILRVVQNNEIKPLGGAKTKKVDVRIISATNKNLKNAIAKQHFREDLFYRLNVLPIHIPPLRERKEDIPLLLEHFMMKEARAMDIEPKKISRETLRFLKDYPWKGNVRELENFVKHILVIVNGNQITMDDLSLHFMELSDIDKVSFPMAPATGQMTVRSEAFLDYASLFGNCTWEEVERAYILYLLEKNRWNITRAAKATGVNRSTFDSRMKKLGIKKS